METYSIWETLTIGVLTLLVVLWFFRGMRAAMARGRTADADWKAVLIPLSLVALFVIFLILKQ